ncbi:30S ribosomal protein S3 [Candidatus Comchoanobacter bicostacola]|uniref:Small ribosomal subunit protein uS3 n=1 Tax=Candidatus Comchoanobacter bicostacola TaxID=2919598 RepID=A0ABY5DKE9_9GAMM|nr:30S ribosomal protein S3 [Candidatus Comchoanobacter bicostacola]UTC24292.1 30S ribosomal protein S3 [Candidatus Comchoanobacter bicostacola]
MGSKVSPKAIRLYNGLMPSSNWCTNSKKNYIEFTRSDMKVREMITNKYPGIDEVIIDRTANDAHVTIHCAKPGMIIGKKGSDAETLKKKIKEIMKTNVHVNIREVEKPDLSAKLLSESVALQLEKRVLFRKAVKRAIHSAMRSGAKGVKVMVSGRLSGAEIARSETYKEGRVPLHTFRADIDYALSLANTTYGVIGVKVWVYKGDKFDD